MHLSPLGSLLDPHRCNPSSALSRGAVRQGDGTLQVAGQHGRRSVELNLQMPKHACHGGETGLSGISATTIKHGLAGLLFRLKRIVSGQESAVGTKGGVTRKVLFHEGVDLSCPGQGDMPDVGRLNVYQALQNKAKSDGILPGELRLLMGKDS